MAIGAWRYRAPAMITTVALLVSMVAPVRVSMPVRSDCPSAARATAEPARTQSAGGGVHRNGPRGFRTGSGGTLWPRGRAAPSQHGSPRSCIDARRRSEARTCDQGRRVHGSAGGSNTRRTVCGALSAGGAVRRGRRTSCRCVVPTRTGAGSETGRAVPTRHASVGHRRNARVPTRKNDEPRLPRRSSRSVTIRSPSTSRSRSRDSTSTVRMLPAPWSRTDSTATSMVRPHPCRSNSGVRGRCRGRTEIVCSSRFRRARPRS